MVELRKGDEYTPTHHLTGAAGGSSLLKSLGWTVIKMGNIARQRGRPLVSLWKGINDGDTFAVIQVQDRRILQLGGENNKAQEARNASTSDELIAAIGTNHPKMDLQRGDPTAADGIGNHAALLFGKAFKASLEEQNAEREAKGLAPMTRLLPQSTSSQRKRPAPAGGRPAKRAKTSAGDGGAAEKAATPTTEQAEDVEMEDSDGPEVLLDAVSGPQDPSAEPSDRRPAMYGETPSPPKSVIQQRTAKGPKSTAAAVEPSDNAMSATGPDMTSQEMPGEDAEGADLEATEDDGNIWNQDDIGMEDQVVPTAAGSKVPESRKIVEPRTCRQAGKPTKLSKEGEESIYAPRKEKARATTEDPVIQTGSRRSARNMTEKKNYVSEYPDPVPGEFDVFAVSRKLEAAQMAVPEGEERNKFNEEHGYLFTKPDGKPLDLVNDIEANLMPTPKDDDKYKYRSFGTHLVGDWQRPQPEYDDIIPMNRLLQFEQIERFQRQQRAAREAAEAAGVEYKAPARKEKWKWYEHLDNGVGRRKRRFGPDGKLLVDSKGRRVGADGETKE